MSDNNWGTRDKALAAAFFSFSGAILALAIYWSGSLAGYQEGRSAEASSRLEAQTKHQVRQACIALTGARLMECVYDETTAAQESTLSEQGLDAQQGMERWAFWMLIAAVFQTLVASGALLFLMKDLRQNRKSAEQQLRAYLTFADIVRSTDKGDSALLIMWLNKGQTPAYKVDAWADWVALPTEMGDDFELTRPIDFSDSPSTIGPDQAIYGKCNGGPTSALFREAAHGDWHIYLWGEVRYEDAFGFNRVSQVALKCDARVIDGVKCRVDWDSIPRHNWST